MTRIEDKVRGLGRGYDRIRENIGDDDETDSGGKLKKWPRVRAQISSRLDSHLTKCSSKLSRRGLKKRTRESTRQRPDQPHKATASITYRGQVRGWTKTSR